MLESDPESITQRVPAPSAFDAPPGSPIALDAGGLVPGMLRWADYPGAPPPFAKPRAGRATTSTISDRPSAARVTLFRSSGARYADATLNEDGDYDSVRYFDSSNRMATALFSSRSYELGRVPRRDSREGISSSSSVTPSNQPKDRRGRKGPSPRERSSPKASFASCQPTGTFADLGYRLYTATTGFYISYSMPSVLSNSILYAADNWNSLQNWCNYVDQSALNVYYAGGTPATAGQNYLNTVDFGSAAQFGGACNTPNILGCTQVYINPDAPPYLIEWDARLGSGRLWAAGGTVPGNYFDVEGVMTHEFGHVIGLGDVSWQREVMAIPIYGGDATDRRLGRGDASAANAITKLRALTTKRLWDRWTRRCYRGRVAIRPCVVGALVLGVSTAFACTAQADPAGSPPFIAPPRAVCAPTNAWVETARGNFWLTSTARECHEAPAHPGGPWRSTFADSSVIGPATPRLVLGVGEAVRVVFESPPQGVVRLRAQASARPSPGRTYRLSPYTSTWRVRPGRGVLVFMTTQALVLPPESGVPSGVREVQFAAVYRAIPAARTRVRRASLRGAGG